MKKRWWIMVVLIIVILILMIVIISNKYFINISPINQSLNNSNNPVFIENGICGACGDICTFGVERMDCPASDRSFECKVINGKCTKVLLNNSAKTCTNDSSCPSGQTCWARCNGDLHCATPEEISIAKPCEPNE